MGVYDGNQLPEQPTSQFQVAVPILYTLFVSATLSIGGFAVLAAQQKPDQEATANLYMRMLLVKHNAIAHGILAFIPATYSLTHLYTSSLHNGSLYSASNIFFVAVFGFATRYLGEALQALRDDSISIDTTTAVYECLYMLTRCYGRLCPHTGGSPNGKVLSDMPSTVPATHKTVRLEALETSQVAAPASKDGSTVAVQVDDLSSEEFARRGLAWLSPWVLLNVFLAVGCQDDSRLWVMFPKWSLRWTWLPNTLDHSVPVTDSPGHRLWLWLKSVGCSMWARLCSLLGCCAASSRSCCPKLACEQLSSDGCTGAHGLRCCCCSEHTNSAYAYWLFAQKDVVRDYTGSLIIKQSLANKLNQASYTTGELYSTAQYFMTVFAKHFISLLSQPLIKSSSSISISCRNGAPIQLSEAVSCLLAVNYNGQALSMACERYMCRVTPAAGATCLPAARLLQAMYHCWELLFGPKVATEQLQRLAAQQAGVDARYWCCLWLQYMHMVLLGVDLLRMHNNSDLFDTTKQEKGFYNIMQQQQPEALKTGLRHSTLHNLSDENLHSLAAGMASLLLAQQMANEALLVQLPMVHTATQVDLSKLEIPFTSKTPTRDQDVLPAALHVSQAVLQKRSQLVRSYSSVPAVVQGVNCLPASDWADSLHGPLTAALLLVTVTSVSIATISCSNGVQLVTVAGSVQAFAAWMLLMHMGRLPVQGRPLDRGVGIPYWFQKLWGCCQVFIDLILQLLITLLSLVDLLIPAEMLALLAGICCSCCFKPTKNGDSPLLNSPCGSSGCCCSSAGDRAGSNSRGEHIRHFTINVGDPRHASVSSWLDPFSDAVAAAANRAGTASLSAAAAGALAAISTHATQVYKRNGATPCECNFDGTELDQPNHGQIRSVTDAATELLAMAAAAELQYIRAAAADLPKQAAHAATGGTAGGAAGASAVLSISDFKARFSDFIKRVDCLLYTGFVGRHVHLGYLMEDENGVLYASRFRAADVALYAFVALSVVVFVGCAVLAKVKEPYYATGPGMCLGRCHNREDCQGNMTVGLPLFEGNLTPECPGKGFLIWNQSIFSADPFYQCPYIGST